VGSVGREGTDKLITRNCLLPISRIPLRLSPTRGRSPKRIMRVSHLFKNGYIWSLVILLTIPNSLAWSQTTGEEIQTNSCPADIEKLTTLLLKDLPNYGNRVIQRTQKTYRDRDIYRYIIAAGKAEFEPLNLPQINYNPRNPQPPKQVFFTVLEREYNNNRQTEIQSYHWLFLTPTSNGWQLVTMFSRFGDSNQNNPPAPPRETSNGIIGQAVQLWLRDCHIGRI
jgi:hypothetical protein